MSNVHINQCLRYMHMQSAEPPTKEFYTDLDEVPWREGLKYIPAHARTPTHTHTYSLDRP